jgi:carboxylesterase type B
MVFHSKGGMIYVAIQYRLGPLGFLAGDHITKDGSWNVGLLDQRAALEWIQDSIHYFGGDPSKVTITGGSAGGSSVTMHMILYGGKKRAGFRAAAPSTFPELAIHCD